MALLYVDLKGKCPAVGCFNTETTYRMHGGCPNSRLQINQKGMLKCNICSIEYSIFDTPWSCDLHPGDFRKADLFRLLPMINLASEAATKMGNLDWQKSILDVFNEQREK